jgi:hypothetical protein
MKKQIKEKLEPNLSSTEISTVLRETGRFHILKCGCGQITLPKGLSAKLPFRHSEKVLLRVENKNLFVSDLNQNEI